MKQQPLVEDAQSFAQNIVDTVREPLLILNADLYIRSANRAFYQTFQVSPEETEDQRIYELGNGQWNIPALRTLLEDIIPQKSAFDDFEIEHDFPAICRRVMLLNARQLRAGNHTDMLVLAMEDVTERRRVHDLEIQFTEGLQESYKRLQEVEKLRDDLKNMIIHDLRTPLTSVITGMQTLEMIGDLGKIQRELVGIAISGGEMLLGMINDLLEVESMESGTMQLGLTALDAAELITSAVSQVAPLAERESLALVQKPAADLPAFWGDDNKLRRVIVNLLGNAIKFTPSGGIITVAARLGNDARSLVFSVSDK